MPTRESITNNLIPKDAPAPIPTRVVNTRGDGPKPKTKDPAVAANGNQPANVVNALAADSATTAESVKLSPQLSALARKEQAFRQRELALKQKEKDLESKLANADQYEQLKTKFGAKDFSEAEKLGLNYEEYTKYRLDQIGGEDPQAKFNQELKAELEGMKKAQVERDEREFEETKGAYVTEIAKLVQSNADFSSIKELKQEPAVLQLILDSWEEDGEEVSVEQACKDIEDFLVNEAKKLTSITKLKPQAETVPERKLPPPRSGVTLTNNMQPSNTTVTADKPLQNMSDQERYAEARRRVLARRQAQGA